MQKRTVIHRFVKRAFVASAIGVAALTALPAAADDDRAAVGAVFVATNHNNTKAVDPNEPANQVAMYRRAKDGSLTFVGYFETGGQGSGPSVRFAGDGLGSSHSVQLSQNNRWLFVTNAQSNNVSVFRVSKDKLERTDLEPSGGVFPDSITQHRDLVYVLNSAGGGNITGFRLNDSGQLTPINDSTRTLDANQDPVRPDTLFNPAQVSFTPDGRKLVVTIKDGPAAGALPGVIPTGPGRVLVFGVDSNGVPTSAFTQTDLQNEGPFGFSFDHNGNLLIGLFIGGPALSGAAGSFSINDDGSLNPISANVPNTQLDTCWLENNGRFAYGANYSSGTISSYRIGKSGQLNLLEAVAGTTELLPGAPGKVQGSTPIDLALSRDGKYLYNVLPGFGAIAAWEISGNGKLNKIGEFPGLASTVDGDHAPFEFGNGGSPAGIAAY